MNSSQLYVAYKKDLASAWNQYRSKYPDHIPYAFVLWGIESPIRFTLHVLSEQGLTEVAKRYVREGIYQRIQEAMDALRFSVADSPFFNELLEQMPTVDTLLKPHVAKLGDPDGYRNQARAAIRALKSLDKQKIFGTGIDRNRLLLCIITEDAAEEWFTRSAKTLNPTAALKQLPKKAEGRFTSCESMTLSPDGTSLYTTGSDQGIRQVAVYKLRRSILKPNWTVLTPALGDGARGVACDPDGKSIVVLRAEYCGDADCTTILMRFRHDREALIAQHRFDGEPDSIAISQNGSRIAISMHKRRIVIFDRNFRQVVVRAIRNARKMIFLRSGRLLVASDQAIQVLDSKTFDTLKMVKINARHLAIDAGERLLAVSGWPTINQILKGIWGTKEKESAVHLFHLPSLKPVRTFLVPGYQARKVVICRNGRLIAFEIRKIGAHLHRIILFDSKSGRELAHRRFDMTNEMLFLRDNRTLAIGVSETTTGHPIKFWRLPLDEKRA